MKYTYVEHAITPTGWGIGGVFPSSVVEGAELHEDGMPIIEERHLVVGTGGGWEREVVMDEYWLRRAVEALNREEGVPK